MVRGVSLREHIEAVLAERWQAHDREHADISEALTLAREASERALVEARVEINARLDKLNELRSEVLTDRSEYVRREVFDQGAAIRDQRLDVLENWRSKATGASVVLVLFAGTIGAAIAKVFLR